MARITVEDCLDKVANRFELVMVSSKRARQLQSEGKQPFVALDNDKPTVISLREIAEGHIGPDILEEVDERDVAGTDESMSQAVAAAEAALAAKTEGELTEAPDDEDEDDDYDLEDEDGADDADAGDGADTDSTDKDEDTDEDDDEDEDPDPDAPPDPQH